MSQKKTKSANKVLGKLIKPSSGRSDSSSSSEPNPKRIEETLTASSGSSVTYFIRLTPAGSFFFGDESVNAEDGSMFYFQRSRSYPQQTSLLGMLRYQLLLQNNLLTMNQQGRELITDSTKAEKLIGTKSFDASNGQEFGAIQRLSPVFMLHEQKRYFPMPFVNKLIQEKNKRNKTTIAISPKLHVSANDCDANWTQTQFHKLETLVDYAAKTGLSTHYVHSQSDIVSTATIYVDTDSLEQIGITKAQPWRDVKETAKEGFFKMTYQRLNRGYSFGMYITLDSSVRLSDGWVFLGKERSMFKMEVSVENEPATWLTSHPAIGAKAVWLLSDACIDPVIYDHCRFVVADTVSFRNILHTTASQDNHYARPVRPGRREMLEKGSLLVPKPDALASLETYLRKEDAFRKIGYNQYIILS